MPRLPFLGRLTTRDYVALIFGGLFVALETILTFIISFLPKSVIQWFYERSRTIFHVVVGPPIPKSDEQRLAERIRRAEDFQRLCEIFGYQHEEHVVLTKDGYLLGLHRLPAKRGEDREKLGTSTGKPVVYLHHGLLMNSEVWICLTSPERSLAFTLVELGFDVWLGNNRGNKYSKKSIHHNPNSTKFWDYSMDDFAWHDIPDSIEYILRVTKEESLSYVGFSQGTAQAFAALSIHPPLNEKINVFIALAPAMSPAGLAASVVDSLMKASPTLVFLIFGRKSIMSSVPGWQSLLYPPLFAASIAVSLRWLFNWHCRNIGPLQRLAAFAHLYSSASVKSVVHWFQIMRNAKFQMFDDDVQRVIRIRRAPRPAGVTAYAPARFPTRNIVSPIVLLYGDGDSLVDIDAMLHELPKRNTRVRRLHGYEHLDVIWGDAVHTDVIPHVVSALREHAVRPERLAASVKMTNGFDAAVAANEATDGYNTPADTLSGYES
ncbi:triacylglycerol lipase [Dichomitus squalens]|uniref:Triacylglycerol lipase n=1 Tax=Dichomitus squalens TaxID=114155 RepID=A0A4Q9P5F4_9APHY|nr:triacylglycerol lipase [Dichomitus squalens]TBU48397.1 triacylglycerol lipase [Dichomitus squalens]TBU64981.1 triacylglycerol lipase [Dichomitus squalens]